MRSLPRILVSATLLILLAMGAAVAWNALRIFQIRSAWRTVGVLPVRRLDLGGAAPIRDAEALKRLKVRPVESGGPGIREVMEVLEFDPAGLSCLSSPAMVGRAHELAKKRVGEFGSTRIAVFAYRGFRGLRSESAQGQDVRYRVFGPQGGEILSVSYQLPDHWNPATGEADGILRSILDSMAKGRP